MSRHAAAGRQPSPDLTRTKEEEFADRYAAARPLEFEPTAAKRNHNVFRYPAKFHPPIARKLVELFTSPGDTVLDPFCGSGTLLVEAATLGRNSVGTDVDPLAVMVARAKTGITNVAAIRNTAEQFVAWLDEQRREDEERWGSFEKDIDEASFAQSRLALAGFIPALPKIDHWFRRRAVLQLAAIRRHIFETADGDAKLFLELCFAAILRNSSNADPVPVSGLEVTSHMLAKERLGRTVDPWRLMKRAIDKSISATADFLAERDPSATSAVHTADARTIDTRTVGPVDAVVTSPPYLTAVDYYRRHTLEMYWLGLTDDRSQRLDLMTRYIGRDRIGLRNMPEETDHARITAERWLPRFPGIRPERARAFRHYCDGMARALACMANVVTPGGPIIIVAGDVRFCGVPVSMLELMNDLADERLAIADHLWYPIVNRYMSYSRRNEASIAADHVIVFRQSA
jgi:DNA modification methylase